MVVWVVVKYLSISSQLQILGEELRQTEGAQSGAATPGGSIIWPDGIQDVIPGASAQTGPTVSGS